MVYILQNIVRHLTHLTMLLVMVVTSPAWLPAALMVESAEAPLQQETAELGSSVRICIHRKVTCTLQVLVPPPASAAHRLSRDGGSPIRPGHRLTNELLAPQLC